MCTEYFERMKTAFPELQNLCKVFKEEWRVCA